MAVAKKKTSKKTTTTKKVLSGNAAIKSKIAKQIQTVIQKKTGKKVEKQNLSQLPHSPSGSTLLDDLIGGTDAPDGKAPICPGYPRQRITEIYGEEASGKTTLALQAIAEAQARGEVCMFIDFEHALHHGYAKNIGVKLTEPDLLLYTPDTLEEGMTMLYSGLRLGAGMIVVDSVAAMVPKKELEKKLDKEAQIGALPRALTQRLPKIVAWLYNPAFRPKGHPGAALLLLNQTRAVINTGGGPGAGKGPTKNTTGGKALKFYAYLRILAQSVKTERVVRKDRFSGKERNYPYGKHTQLTIIKSKVDAKEGAQTDIFIRFGKGIDDILSLIEAGVNHKFVKKSGAFYEIGDHKLQGREKFREFLLSNPKVAEALRKKVLLEIRRDLDDIPDEVSDEDRVIAEIDKEFGDDDMEEVDEEMDEDDAEGIEPVDMGAAVDPDVPGMEDVSEEDDDDD